MFSNTCFIFVAKELCAPSSVIRQLYVVDLVGDVGPRHRVHVRVVDPELSPGRTDIFNVRGSVNAWSQHCGLGTLALSASSQPLNQYNSERLSPSLLSHAHRPRHAASQSRRTPPGRNPKVSLETSPDASDSFLSPDLRSWTQSTRTSGSRPVARNAHHYYY